MSAAEAPARSSQAANVIVLGLGLVVAQQAVAGTLPTWLRSKFLRSRSQPARANVRITGGETHARGNVKSPSAFGWALPVPVGSRCTSRFGAPRDGGTRTHQGIDFAAATGTPITAARDGTVTTAATIGGYGLVVYVRHGDGSETRYAHLSVITVKVGDRIRAGQRVGLSGNTGNSTGPHLHFEIRDPAGNAVDPQPLLGIAKCGNGAT